MGGEGNGSRFRREERKKTTFIEKKNHFERILQLLLKEFGTNNGYMGSHTN